MREAPRGAEVRIALAVDRFLGYTNAWVYRQAVGGPSRAAVVLCHERTCQEDFPFEPVVVSPQRMPKLFRKLRGKLWPILKFLPPRLSARQQREFTAPLREHHVNLVHAHFGTTGARFAPLCRRLGIPLVITVHGHDVTSALRRWPAYRRTLKTLWDECPFFIVISQEMGQRLQQMGCPADRIRVSYLGVPTESFPFVDRSPRQGPVRFLHAGRLTAKKGVPDLVRAFVKAFPTPNAAVLEIVGDGEERQLIEQTIGSASPANAVMLSGKLSVEELAAARERADVFVLNCRVDEEGTTEGLPISTLEAACTGLPAVSTHHAGIPESIRDGETGLLVPERDQDALAAALRALVDKESRLRMGRAARAFMEQQFAIEACNARLGDLYEEAVGIGSGMDRRTSGVTTWTS